MKLRAIFASLIFSVGTASAASHSGGSATFAALSADLGENKSPNQSSATETRKAVNEATAGVVRSLGCVAQGRDQDLKDAIQAAAKRIHPLGVSPELGTGKFDYPTYLRYVAWDYLEDSSICKRTSTVCYRQLHAPLAQLFQVLSEADLQQPAAQSKVRALKDTLTAKLAWLNEKEGVRLPCNGVKANDRVTGGEMRLGETAQRETAAKPQAPAETHHASDEVSPPSQPGHAERRPASDETKAEPRKTVERPKAKCASVARPGSADSNIPAEGRTTQMWRESHLITQSESEARLAQDAAYRKLASVNEDKVDPEKILGAFPKGLRDGIQEHLDASCALLKRRFGVTDCSEIYEDPNYMPRKSGRNWSKEWTPAEGGKFGQGSSKEKPDLLSEMFTFTMRWSPRVPAGTKFLLSHGGKTVVAVAGYEWGPGSTNGGKKLGGVQPELQYFLGAKNSSPIKVQLLADQNLPIGPIDCQ